MAWWPGGRVVGLLEGGYDLGALGRSAVAATAALLGDPPPEVHRDALTDEERGALARALSAGDLRVDAGTS